VKPHRKIRRGVLAVIGIVVMSPAMAAGAQEQNHGVQGEGVPARIFRIAGTIVDANTGTPLAQARVSIAVTNNRNMVTSMVTNSDGHFEFDQLEAGKYSLVGMKRGYIASAYDQHEQYSTAIVTGPGYATQDLILRLTPMAFISGHVIDEGGLPVRNAQVVIYREDHAGGMTRVNRLYSSMTDDRGYYDFSLLRPANYFISATGKPWYAVHPMSAMMTTGSPDLQTLRSLDVAYPTTYYNGATDSDSATPVEVKGGDHLQIDIRLSPVPALHLIYRIPPNATGANLFQKFPQFQRRVFDSIDYQRVDGTHLVAPGVYELTGVPAGRYTVRVADPTTGEYQQTSDVDFARNGQVLNDSPGEPVGSLALTLKMANEGALPKQYSVALLNSGRRAVAVQQGTLSGEVSFEDLAPGKYSIVVNSPAAFFYVARTSTSAGDSEGDGVNIGSGAAVELTAVLKQGVVDVEGVVESKGKPTAGVMVALVPEDPDSRMELFRRDQSDFDGTFKLQGVIPGTYAVIAVQDVWGFDWMKAGILARYLQGGEKVRIDETARGEMQLPKAVEAQAR
jgi:protocatechuate 3,4-dioxygenase beta subunit